MTGPRDLYFYHYTKKEVALERLLPSGRLQFGTVKSSNDPWEFEKKYFQTIRDNGARSAHEGDIPYVLEEVDAYIKSHGRLLCFSIDDWQRRHDSLWRGGFCKPRMWAQYGDNHEGVCLVSSVSKLDAYGGRELVPPGLQIIKGKVEYMDTIELESVLRIEIEEREHLERGTTGRRVVEKAEFYANERMQKHYRTLFFTKHVDWADENEYRYLSWSDVADGLFSEVFYPLPETIAGIVVGCRFPSCYEGLVKTYGEAWNVPVLKLLYFNGKPVAEPIHAVQESDFMKHVEQLDKSPDYMPEYKIT